jgi:hypothetical protein
MLQMVRKYKGKIPTTKWSAKESMSNALASVMFGDVRIRRVVDVFRVPCETEVQKCIV